MIKLTHKTFPGLKTLRRAGIIFIILSWVMLCGLECHWPGDGGGASSGTGAGTDDPPETLSTTTEATVLTIDATTMDVETDDEVILTCDLPSGVVLIVGDRIEVTIDFESDESMWVITGSEFYQKL